MTAHHDVPRVLLVEDDDDMRESLAAVLRDDGYEVIALRDGGQYLVCIGQSYVNGQARDSFELIISDLHLPVCSGLQILEQLRSAHWHTPTIVITAFADPDTKRRTEALGALLLTKPFGVDELLRAVESILPPPSRPSSPPS